MADRRPAPPPRAALGEFSPGRKLSAVSMDAHPSARERGALRCGLHDAVILVDQVAEKVEREHTVRGCLTKAGIERVALVKLVADLIWQMRDEIEMPPAEEARHG